MPLPPVGARVRVPVGSRVLTGCVVEYPIRRRARASSRTSSRCSIDEPLLPPDVVALCRWVADYYLAGVGDAIAAAMPPGARRKATSFKTDGASLLRPRWGQTPRVGSGCRRV